VDYNCRLRQRRHLTSIELSCVAVSSARDALQQSRLCPKSSFLFPGDRRSRKSHALVAWTHHRDLGRFLSATWPWVAWRCLSRRFSIGRACFIRRCTPRMDRFSSRGSTRKDRSSASGSRSAATNRFYRTSSAGWSAACQLLGFREAWSWHRSCSMRSASASLLRQLSAALLGAWSSLQRSGCRPSRLAATPSALASCTRECRSCSCSRQHVGPLATRPSDRSSRRWHIFAYGRIHSALWSLE